MSVNSVMIAAASVHRVHRVIAIIFHTAASVGHFALKTNIYGWNKNKYLHYRTIGTS